MRPLQNGPGIWSSDVLASAPKGCTVVCSCKYIASRAQRDTPTWSPLRKSEMRSGQRIGSATPADEARGSADGRRARSERLHRLQARDGGGEAHRARPDPRGGTGPPRRVADARAHGDHVARSTRPADTRPSARGSGHGSRDAGDQIRRDDRGAGRDARQRPRASPRPDPCWPPRRAAASWPPYVAGAGKVILVVGTQKIVADVEEGLRRIYEYAFPLEDARAHGGVRHPQRRQQGPDHQPRDRPGRITVVLVDEALGF